MKLYSNEIVFRAHLDKVCDQLSDANLDKITKRVLRDIGYLTDYEIIANSGKQYQDIAIGVNDEVCRTDDNGIMFRYICTDTNKYLPTDMVIL